MVSAICRKTLQNFLFFSEDSHQCDSLLLLEAAMQVQKKRKSAQDSASSKAMELGRTGACFIVSTEMLVDGSC